MKYLNLPIVLSTTMWTRVIFGFTVLCLSYSAPAEEPVPPSIVSDGRPSGLSFASNFPFLTPPSRQASSSYFVVDLQPSAEVNPTDTNRLNSDDDGLISRLIRGPAPLDHSNDRKKRDVEKETPVKGEKREKRSYCAKCGGSLGGYGGGGYGGGGYGGGYGNYGGGYGGQGGYGQSGCGGGCGGGRPIYSQPIYQQPSYGHGGGSCSVCGRPYGGRGGGGGLSGSYSSSQSSSSSGSFGYGKK